MGMDIPLHGRGRGFESLIAHQRDIGSSGNQKWASDLPFLFRYYARHKGGLRLGVAAIRTGRTGMGVLVVEGRCMRPEGAMLDGREPASG